MKEKIKKNFSSVKDFYKRHPKRFWVVGIVVIFILISFIRGGSKETVTIVPVSRTDLKETVLATGQVTSNTDLDLSFSTSDVVQSIAVSVGSKVYKGQVLATLDNRDEYATLKSAQAKYQKVVEGASNEEIAVAQAQLDSAKSDLVNARNTQNTLLENARRDLMNTDLTPTLSSGTTTTPPTVTGTYTGQDEGYYSLVVNLTSGSGYFTYTGVESGRGDISSDRPMPLGTKGLFIQFPSAYSSYSGNVWKVLLPNTASTTYLADYNAYQSAQSTHDSAIASAEALVKEREANLALKKAAARTADLDVAEADVLSASVAYEKTILRAPASGTIVQVDTKIGELVTAQKEVMVLQDVGNLYVEAKINEANIAKILLDQVVDMTLDAFGPQVHFTGTVVHIDPSATTDDGVVNYKIKASIQDPACNDTAQCASYLPIIRPGMNANMTIVASETPNVLAIPKAAITTEADGQTMVNVITNEKRKKYMARAITTGKEGDGNLIEITSGLAEGEKIALIQK